MRSAQVRKYLKVHFEIKTYKQFKESILQEKGLKKLPLRILNDLFFRHIKVDRAQHKLNAMGYSAFNFKDEVERHYCSWKKAFEKVKIPFIIRAHRRGQDPVKTYITVGYSVVSAAHHNSLSKRLFFGANTETVLLFLEMNPDISTLEDFNIAYKQGFLGKVD